MSLIDETTHVLLCDYLYYVNDSGSNFAFTKGQKVPWLIFDAFGPFLKTITVLQGRIKFKGTDGSETCYLTLENDRSVGNQTVGNVSSSGNVKVTQTMGF
jgi:hypothetical protein